MHKNESACDKFPLNYFSILAQKRPLKTNPEIKWVLLFFKQRDKILSWASVSARPDFNLGQKGNTQITRRLFLSKEKNALTSIKCRTPEFARSLGGYLNCEVAFPERLNCSLTKT